MTDLDHLVVRAQTGDREAYGHLVRRFQDMAVGYARSLLGDFHLAEDAAQEAFVGAWRELPRLRDPAAFPGWFRRVVFMRCSRFRRLRRGEMPLEDAAEPPSANAGPAERLEEGQTREWVLGAVDRLPPEERLATLLFYLSGHSHQQIADFLDVPRATVNNRLRSARAHLHKEMLAMTKKNLRAQAPSRDERFAQRVARLLQPDAMQTATYLYGIEPVDGHDAWALFCASAAGDLARVRALLDRDPALVNAQYWYQFPIHMAVREGRAEVVQLLLDAGADPGQSRYTYNSWDKLLEIARQRGYTEIGKLLAAAMQERFAYDPAFAPLADAIKAREGKKVEAMLEESPALLRAADALGNGPLHWAALTRQTDLIDLFVDRGADLEARRADGQTPLLVALNGDYWYRSRNLPAEAPRDPWTIVRHLLERGAHYCLSIACAAGDKERVRTLLQADPALARRLDPGRRSPLSYAAANGHTAVVEALLDAGADPNRPEDLAPRGRALFEACAGNHLETAALLLERGADAGAGVDSSGSCLTIVQHRHPDSCGPVQELLRRHGAYMPPYALDDRELEEVLQTGGPALSDPQILHELMGRENSAALLRLALDKRPELVDRLSLTDIYGGNFPRDPELIRALAERGLDLNRANWIGRTFLHSSAEKGDIEAARTLLEMGADMHAIELEHGGTPLAAAARKGQADMVRFLLKEGADPAIPAESPWARPLHWAQREGREDIAALLEKHLQ